MLAEAACKKQGEKGKQVAVEMASDFYRAEEYHQKYIEKQNGRNSMSMSMANLRKTRRT